MATCRWWRPRSASATATPASRSSGTSARCRSSPTPRSSAWPSASICWSSITFAGYAAAPPDAAAARRAPARGRSSPTRRPTASVASLASYALRRAPVGAGDRRGHAGQRVSARSAGTARRRHCRETWDGTACAGAARSRRAAGDPDRQPDGLLHALPGSGRGAVRRDERGGQPGDRRLLRSKQLRELVDLLRAGLPRAQPDRAPTRRWSRRDDLVYCPFAYGYSNYARPGIPTAPLRFGGLVALDGRRLRSTLGGTGLAISRAARTSSWRSPTRRFVASPDCQRGLYAPAAASPAIAAPGSTRRSMLATGDFFRDTLPNAG